MKNLGGGFEKRFWEPVSSAEGPGKQAKFSSISTTTVNLTLALSRHVARDLVYAGQLPRRSRNAYRRWISFRCCECTLPRSKWPEINVYISLRTQYGFAA
ncbi:hypothetical protein Moror_16959 [Moniliophthora roreri MCA 2997]|uniref:Uncharacterized protein n=1 Tax=Moniliophthora roreri (strain MCA 2997) TaxID=1381753 RepID=V2WRL9_MONRO|nr:hypothetical protein Moror_16959 [Moniliophthora roreri MCA 2997]